MNLKHDRIIIFFLALTLSICFFVVVDIAYDERIWEFGAFTLKARLQAFGITAVSFYLSSYFFRRTAHFFINKAKGERIVNRKEYMFVFAIILILLNIIYIFVAFYITGMGFRWREALLVNMVGSTLLFLYYTMIRNRILLKNFVEQSLQLEKVKVDQLETELKFLKSQYHPHFLFNALNTIYFQIDEENKDAKHSMEKLSDLLRYQIYNIEKEVTMEQEISYLRSYIDFQQLRMSERLVLDVYFDPELKEQKIHPLLFQPLIENAFKYVRGDYKIQLEMKLNGNHIQTEIKNSISKPQKTNDKKDERIGVENLKRRLDLLYPNKHSLEIKQAGSMFVVKLSISTD